MLWVLETHASLLSAGRSKICKTLICLFLYCIGKFHFIWSIYIWKVSWDKFRSVKTCKLMFVYNKYLKAVTITLKVLAIFCNRNISTLYCTLVQCIWRQKSILIQNFCVCLNFSRNLNALRCNETRRVGISYLKIQSLFCSDVESCVRTTFL